MTEDPGLPVLIGRASSDEYVAPPLSEVVREAMRRTRRSAEDAARRLGVSRREFLLSAMGTATALATLNACSREANRAASGSGTTPGGSFPVPATAATDGAAAKAAVGGEEFIMDVQGHLLDYKIVPDGVDFTGFEQARCGEADKRDCFDIEHFLTEVFLRSDTDVAVLSSIPIAAADPDPLSEEVMEHAKRVATSLCGDNRIFLQGQALPSSGRLDAAMDAMRKVASEHRLGSWKVYTAGPGPGWSFTDEIGEALLRTAVETGVPTVSVHKGISGGNVHASPADIGPAASLHRDIRFVVYHSGWEPGVTEGRFDAAKPNAGVDRLIASLQTAGIDAGGNVYAELGTTWFNLMTKPTEAAHLLGKLLLAVGDDNVVWGTDSIWYGSPQNQIQAFRAFEISEELQERHGYPALTPERKAKILGLNAARIYNVDAAKVRANCAFTRDELEEVRKTLPGRNGPSSR